MKKIALILILLVVLLSVFSYHNNNDPLLIISGLGKDGFSGRAMKYRINLFGIIPVGNAVFEPEWVQEYNGTKVYHLTARAGSLKIFSGIFNAAAVLDSYVDIKKSSPLLFKQKIAIAGKPEKVKEAYYDQDKGIMTIAGIKRQILPATQDPLSAVFNLRHMQLDKIKELEMNINTNQKNYILKGAVSLRQLAIDKNTYDIAVVKATIRRRDKDNPYHQSRLTMVLLRDKENIPLLIRVFASGMLINARLVEIGD